MPLFSFSSKDSDFQIKSFENIKDFTHVRLNQIMFYNGLYNVTSNNNKLSFKTSASDTGIPFVQNLITISPGNYSLDELITAIQGQSDLLITPNQIEGKLIFTISTTDYFSFDFGPETLNSILGLSLTSNSPFSQNFKAPRMFELILYNNVYLLSNLISPQGYLSNDISGQKSNILASIPIDKSFSEYILFPSGTQTEFQKIQDPTLEQLSFRLIDEKGKDINLNGLSVVIVLEFVSLNLWTLWDYLIMGAVILLILVLIGIMLILASKSRNDPSINQPSKKSYTRSYV